MKAPIFVGMLILGVVIGLAGFLLLDGLKSVFFTLAGIVVITGAMLVPWMGPPSSSPKKKENPFPHTKEDFELLEKALVAPQEWILQEVEKNPIIFNLNGFHKIFEDQESYRDLLGWARENLRRFP